MVIVSALDDQIGNIVAGDRNCPGIGGSTLIQAQSFLPSPSRNPRNTASLGVTRRSDSFEASSNSRITWPRSDFHIFSIGLLARERFQELIRRTVVMSFDIVIDQVRSGVDRPVTADYADFGITKLHGIVTTACDDWRIDTANPASVPSSRSIYRLLR